MCSLRFGNYYTKRLNEWKKEFTEISELLQNFAETARISSYGMLICFYYDFSKKKRLFIKTKTTNERKKGNCNILIVIFQKRANNTFDILTQLEKERN